MLLIGFGVIIGLALAMWHNPPQFMRFARQSPFASTPTPGVTGSGGSRDWSLDPVKLKLDAARDEVLRALDVKVTAVNPGRFGK